MSEIIQAFKNAFLHSFDRDWGLLILRLGLGLTMFFGHGYGKFMNFDSRAAGFADPIGVGPVPSFVMVVFAEALCSLLVAVGLLTRFALVPLLVAMSVAVFIAHAADPFARKELAVVFLCGFAALFFTGPGSLSLDRIIFKNRSGG
jgi:putative oxidoreductase